MFSFKGYDDGGYRPAHIHFNITAEGYPELITQLYFNQDYYLAPRDSCERCKSFIVQKKRQLFYLL
jgi:protocatechuate 3,4-dioxygenase beta subunit